MKHLRKGAGVLAGILTVTILSGCKNIENVQVTDGVLSGVAAIAPIEQVEYEPCSITFSLLGDETADNAVLTAVEAFEAKYPGMQIQLQTNGMISDVNRVHGKVTESITSPEETYYNLYEAYEVLTLGAFGQENLNRCTIGDSLQALPSELSIRTFFFNETVFVSTGLAVPDSIDELLAAGNVFKEKLGEEYYPLALTERDRVLLFINYLQSLYGKNWTVDGVMQYKVEELMKGMEFLLSLETEHVIPSLDRMTQTMSAEQGWSAGVYAGVTAWDDTAEQYRDALQEGQTFCMGTPLTDKLPYCGGIAKVSEVYMVSANCEHKREAALFIDFLLNQEEGVTAMADGRKIPLSREARAFYMEKGLAEEEKLQTKEMLLDSIMMGWDEELERLYTGELPTAYSRVINGLSYGEYNAREAAQLLLDGMAAK